MCAGAVGACWRCGCGERGSARAHVFKVRVRAPSRALGFRVQTCEMQMLTLEEHNSCIALKQKCQRRSGWTKVSSRATSSLTINPACVTRRLQCGQTGLARCMNAITQLRHMAECPHSKRTWRGADMHRMHSRSTLPGALPPPPGAWKDTPGLEGHARLLVSRASRRPRIECTHAVCARTCQLVAAPA